MDTGDGKPLTAAEAAALESNPLYCKACGKLFAKDTVFSAHLPGKKHKKNVEALEALGAAGAPPAATAAIGGSSDASRFHAPATQVALWRDIALVEYQIDMMATLLQDFVAATQAYVRWFVVLIRCDGFVFRRLPFPLCIHLTCLVLFVLLYLSFS